MPVPPCAQPGLSMLWLLALCVAVHAGGTPVQQLVDAQYQDYIASKPYMGIAVGVIHPSLPNGSAVYVYGVQNGSGPAVTRDTQFAINSMTKVFTALVLAVAVDQGRVQLTAPIQASIPQHHMPTDAGQEIQFLDLATHCLCLLSDMRFVFWCSWFQTRISR
jgi:D-alanyl-D-alanine-carboxypeptidase/D-alanyl-D-alanine-endopeptidase